MKLNNPSLKVIFSTFALLILSLQSYSQNKQYPQGYFIFPIKPGQQNFIAGSMGELRPNHFHGGIDIKTGGVINNPVYASADGYVCRIKVSTTGYGNVLYVRHPNNYVTVYAHLEKFSKPIADYVRRKQYEQESFNIELFPGKEELKVSQKEVIAMSGNSGGSTGPHLHYEIRDTLDYIFNPLLFGFDEIKDNMSPIFSKIAIRPLDIQSRVNNEFERFEYAAIPAGKNYNLSGNISAFGTFGIEIKAFDKMNGTSNTYGLERVEVIFDGDTVYQHDIDFHPIEQSRCINAHIDYCTYVNKGQRFEKCYVSDGNTLPIYKTNSKGGRITITDDQMHNVKINIYDGSANTSSISFKIKGEQPKTKINAGAPVTTSFDTEVIENVYKVTSKASSPLSIYYPGNKTATVEPDYQKGLYNVFLINLRNGMPDSVKAGNHIERTYFASMVPPGKSSTVMKGNFQLQIPPDALFDTLYLQLRTEVLKDGRERIYVGDNKIPLYRPINLSLTPGISYNSFYRLYSYNKYNRPDFLGGSWENNSISAMSKTFGNFVLDKDTIAPTITLKSIQANTISLIIRDEKSGIDSFRATLNGEWILMNYDHKRNLIWSDRLEKTTPLKGNFYLEVTDGSGNVSIFKTKL